MNQKLHFCAWKNFKMKTETNKTLKMKSETEKWNFKYETLAFIYRPEF